MTEEHEKRALDRKLAGLTFDVLRLEQERKKNVKESLDVLASVSSFRPKADAEMRKQLKELRQRLMKVLGNAANPDQ
jgi:hypothetical protein